MTRVYSDTNRHKGLRRHLIDTLRDKGITDESVLQAIYRVPRHFFMDTALDHIAYEDRAFPIGEGQTISQPFTVAFQTQLLNIKPGDKVLEIGTGSAYQACVLAEMGARVFTIERQKKLYDQNRQFAWLQQFPNIQFFYGDGFEGLPQYAPFQKIIITAAAPVVPPKLLQQLQEGGIMVLPLDEGDRQRMCRLTMEADGQYREEAFSHFSFVPMLTGRKE